MSWLLSVATAVPLFAVSQDEALAAARVIFDGRIPHLGRLLTVFSNAGIERRYFAVPLDCFREPHSREHVNRTFIETATELSAQAIRKALDHCSLQPTDIDYLVFVNTTGLAHVNDYLLGHPDQIGVIVAAEFCGLTFIADDDSKSNSVASALFGDGVGAAVLAGSSVPKDGLEIAATRSRDMLHCYGNIRCCL